MKTKEGVRMYSNEELTDKVNKEIDYLLYYYTLKEVAELLGISRVSIYNWRSKRYCINRITYRAVQEKIKVILKSLPENTTQDDNNSSKVDTLDRIISMTDRLNAQLGTLNQQVHFNQ